MPISGTVEVVEARKLVSFPCILEKGQTIELAALQLKNEKLVFEFDHKRQHDNGEILDSFCPLIGHHASTSPKRIAVNMSYRNLLSILAIG